MNKKNSLNGIYLKIERFELVDLTEKASRRIFTSILNYVSLHERNPSYILLTGIYSPLDYCINHLSNLLKTAKIDAPILTQVEKKEPELFFNLDDIVLQCYYDSMIREFS